VISSAQRTSLLQRDWWLRALVVLQKPSAVFAAMRDDSDEAAEARGEPLTAIVVLAGIAGVLSSSFAGRLLDIQGFDSLDVAMWAFFGGAIDGALVFWLGGLVVYSVARGLGGRSTYRQGRHVVGFAAVPLALVLLFVWPVRLAVYGTDVFRAGGADSGLGATVLVVVGARAVNGWTWPRAR